MPRGASENATRRKGVAPKEVLAVTTNPLVVLVLFKLSLDRLVHLLPQPFAHVELAEVLL
jgi:hypothetical protein